METLIRLISFILSISWAVSVTGQTYYSNENLDFLRRQQLTKGKHTNQSFLIYAMGFDSIDSNQGHKGISILPFSTVQQFQSHHPFSLNDEGMIPARGYQVLMTGGVRFRIGKRISLQIKPQMVMATNPSHEGFLKEHADITWNDYYDVLNTIELPEQFGNKPYIRLFPGQSSLRYNINKFSFGISTENLWWGPGNRNTLVMTNTAPGFLHFTANTIKPLHTKIGTIEAQLIAGKLENSDFDPPQTNRVYNGLFLFRQKKNEWRYITGLAVTWQPKWLHNLFLGLAKTSYLYHNDIASAADVLPFQGIIPDRNSKKKSLGSLFLRYIIPQEKAEFYFEFGRADKAMLPWGIVDKEAFRRAYVFGARKIFSLNKKDNYIETLAELTQLQMPTIELIKQKGSWYTDSVVSQGYTNEGQLLGAGIGPGANSQSIEVNWLRSKGQFGIAFERLNHNNDFYYKAFGRTGVDGDFRRYWVDISTHVNASLNFNKYQLSGTIGLRRSLNYQWYVFDAIQTPSQYFNLGYDVLNFEAKITATYKF